MLSVIRKSSSVTPTLYPKSKEYKGIILAPLFLLTGIIFDYATPLGVASAPIYVLFVLSAIWFHHPHTAFIFACIATILTLGGYFVISDINADIRVIQLNRSLSMLSLWSVALIVYFQQTTANRLLKNEGRLQAVLDETVDGIITINDKGSIETFNKACENIFGYHADEVIGKNVKVLMPEPYRHEHDGYLQNYKHTGQKKIIGVGREVEGKRKDGSVFPLDLSVSEVRFEDKRIFSGIVRDISERKLQDELRQKLVDKLTESNTELERFAYIASHDMQEPIRMVTNFSEIIAKEYGKNFDEQGKEYLNYVIKSGARMRNLVEDLLAYSRMGNESVQIVSFDANDILSGALENIKGLIKDRKAEVSHDPLPELYGNPVQIMRLLQNLITNAIKYQKPDNIPRIHVGVENQGDHWCFSVKDNGIGIKQGFAEQIFQPFRRLHTWDNIQGTGLGLSICKKIVENCDGRIWVTTTQDKGSTFYFTVSKHLNSRLEAA
ncbi:MAG: sensor histidine kinase [Rickettsiales bacterium]